MNAAVESEENDGLEGIRKADKGDIDGTNKEEELSDLAVRSKDNEGVKKIHKLEKHKLIQLSNT